MTQEQTQRLSVNLRRKLRGIMAGKVGHLTTVMQQVKIQCFCQQCAMDSVLLLTLRKHLSFSSRLRVSRKTLE